MSSSQNTDRQTVDQAESNPTWEIDDVESLLNYVFNPETDFPAKPSIKQYNKLKRIMHIMVGFYEKGAVKKAAQKQDAEDELAKAELDLKMAEEQLASLSPFPEQHPRKSYYVQSCREDVKNIGELVTIFKERRDKAEKLCSWSKGIVEAVKWLEKNLEAYCNENIEGSHLKIDETVMQLPKEKLMAYKKGLDEITYNLQESQDFFNASIDGRLTEFHQIEKCMIEAQLGVLRSYPDSSQRKKVVMEDLKNNLATVEEVMNESPKVKLHRDKMRQIHRDFFAVLKWQRERMAKLGFGEIDEKVGNILKNGVKEGGEENGNDVESRPKMGCPLSEGERENLRIKHVYEGEKV